MKKFMKSVLILMLLLSFFYIASAMSNTTLSSGAEDPMITVFEKSGADILEANITTTLEVPYTVWSKEEIISIKEDIKKQLNLVNKKEVIIQDEYQLFYENEITQDDHEKLFIHEFSDIGINQIIATNTNEKDDILTFKIYSADVQGEKTSYIIIDIIQNKRYKDIVEKSNQSQAILGKYGDMMETVINFTGTYDGKLSDRDSKEKIDEIIHSVKGKIVEEVISQSYISTTVYTPIIPQAIEYGDKKVNLHLAMRYNNYEDKTYLYIANPLITLGY
ncbi:TATA-box binding [Anaerovirgula multivorans]|uniref:TATA-box binding n=1 Tax=Anaerovirgula multivorans TaxID=312168 RepID=A0A239EZR5_9FIRM|nr:YwmB family TATA-box binding protein [Anaerovirgula multivorans]SNS49951.1 TATA-box binding [Anaerovirgula multivorans]